MLGLAEHLTDDVQSTFLSFREGGRCEAFLHRVRDRGYHGTSLQNDTPHLFAAVAELQELLRTRSADLLLCHGYKANIVGRLAARRAGLPVVAVSRGWTGESARVRLYERLDRWHLKFLDRVVCVSDGQAAKVRRAGVPEEKIRVIRNSVLSDIVHKPECGALRNYFATGLELSEVVVAAGRLSPEKGFAVLVDAAVAVLRESPTAGFIVFGEGGERHALERRIRELGIADRFVLPGFLDALDSVLPAADVVVLPSFTEGLPNVVLEASAAGVPVVATAVGGTPEAIREGGTGYLVPSGDPAPLAERIVQLLRDPSARRRMGIAGREFVRSDFSFESQAAAYLELAESLVAQRFPVAV